MNLPNPVIRSHYGNGFVKQYVRDHVLLRTEPASHNVNDYGCKKAVEKLPQLREKMYSVIDNYQNIQQDILETFVDRGQMRKQTGLDARLGPIQPHCRSEYFFLKLFERIYAPLTAGLLRPFSGDTKLQQQKRTQLDRLYQRVVDDLNKLMDAVGLKAA